MEALEGSVRGREGRIARETRREGYRRGMTNVRLAALRATAPLAPVAAVVFTVFAHVLFGVTEAPAKLGETSWYAVALGAIAVVSGAVAAGLVWYVLSSFGERYTAASNANLRNYNLLHEELCRLRTRIGHAGADADIAASRAYSLARRECDEIARGLESRGMPWVTGLGYVEMWHRVHRAEEALILLEPHADALAGAMRDELRLVDSTIKNKDLLLQRLGYAAEMLDPAGARGYLAEPASKPAEEERRSRMFPATRGNGRSSPEEKEMALKVLSEVRCEINNFRDDAWEAIVHARNRLLDSSVFLGFAAYLLLGLAVFMNVGHSTTVWVVAYFLVGALAGLFSRSQAEWTSNKAVDDFGLSTARLIHIPWLSGLAGVGGVLVTSVADALVTDAKSSSDLVAIFDGTPALLIVAAIFGLTPDLLTQRLRQQDEAHKKDLQSTQTSQSIQADASA